MIDAIKVQFTSRRPHGHVTYKDLSPYANALAAAAKLGGEILPAAPAEDTDADSDELLIH